MVSSHSLELGRDGSIPTRRPLAADEAPQPAERPPRPAAPGSPPRPPLLARLAKPPTRYSPNTERRRCELCAALARRLRQAR
mmetsp:Transcript_9731/g.17124  ORF Transcript_9731/g.17124 Transcript_9731/m.17124 type:complete len:82 (-) Transcript_9731:294-539(-)